MGEEKGDVDVSRELLLKAADSLREAMELALGKLRARKVRNADKVRFMRVLTKEVEAAVGVAEALKDVESRGKEKEDFALYLSKLGARVPQKFVSKKFRRILRKFDRNAGERYVVRVERKRHARKAA